MEQQVEDIAGIRIICQFVEDIERVAQIINARSDYRDKKRKRLYQTYEGTAVTAVII